MFGRPQPTLRLALAFLMKMRRFVFVGLLLFGVTQLLYVARAGSNLDLARKLNQAFVEVTERVSSTVVVIDVVQKALPAAGEESLDGKFDSLPPGFWRRFHKEFERQSPGRSLGQGSGVIIRKNGYILTNRHVIEDADKITVRLKDGRSFPAVIRGLDPQSDLAVLKIEANGLPVARLADSNKTRVGEFAIAIGAPFNLDYSFTYGHVSAKGRSNVLQGFEAMAMDQDFIQTDANMNPGNSGGPLVNIDGEVIGINTLIRGVQTGIGFAIPSNLAREISDKLVAEGKFARPWLGISIQALKDQPDLRSLVPGVEDGVVVSGIVPDGPVAGSDLRPSDVITAVDGTRVSTPQQLRSEIRGKKIGAPVTLQVARAGKTMKINVRPAEWAEPTLAVVKRSTPDAVSKSAKPQDLGLTVQDLTPELAAQFDVSESEGVLVTAVGKGTPAEQKGIKPGCVITSVDQEPVRTVAQFREAMRKANPQKGVLLNLRNADAAKFEVLKGD